MFAIAAFRCSPIARAEGSLKDAPVAPVAAGAGEGVAGGAPPVVPEGAACGAAGVDVVVVTGAGVAGGAGDASGTLGWWSFSI